MTYFITHKITYLQRNSNFYGENLCWYICTPLELGKPNIYQVLHLLYVLLLGPNLCSN